MGRKWAACISSAIVGVCAGAVVSFAVASPPAEASGTVVKNLLLTSAVRAQLVAAGADPTDLAEACYQSFRAERLLLIAEVFKAIHFASHNRVAWFCLTPDMYARSGALPDETEGLIEYLQSVKTVEVAFLLESLPEGLTRASMRSRGKVDVQRICHEFGGGGHRLAAGLRTKLDPAALEKKLLDLIAQQLPN